MGRPKNALNVKIDVKEPQTDSPLVNEVNTVESLKEIYALAKKLHPEVYALKKKDEELARKIAKLQGSNEPVKKPEEPIVKKDEKLTDK